MEVDTTPPPGSTSASPGPPSSIAGPSTSAFAFVTRKRRRSSIEASRCWQIEDVGEAGFGRGGPSNTDRHNRDQWRSQMLHFGDQYTSLKRRHMQNHHHHTTGGTDTADTQVHHFASLGAAVSDDELASMAAPDDWAHGSLPESSHQAVLRTQAEDGVDSDMHMLRLASNSPPSPSPSAQEDVLSQQAAASNSGLSTTFLPRQMRTSSATRQMQRSTSLSQRDHSTPFQPSPLAQQPPDTLETTAKERVQTSLDADSFVPASASAVAPLPPPLRRIQTSSLDTLPSRRYSMTLLNSTISSAMSEDGDGSVKSMTGSTSSDDESEALRGRSHWRSKPSFSPGLSSSPNFPGGKHMLRYTMGYRNDCELCRSRTPGHYGHVVHRP